MALEIVPATPDHIPLLAPVMREPDRREVWAATRSSPAEALSRSLQQSQRAWSVFFDGELGAMWGVMRLSLIGETGVPWLLTGPAVERHPIAFLRRSVTLRDEMHEIYPVLRNAVDARHEQCIRWLRWLGFEIQPPVPTGPDRLPFHPFERHA